MATNAPAVLFSAHVRAGAFYAIMPHGAMVTIFGGAFLYAIFALVMGVRSFWRDTGEAERASAASVWRALHDAATLRYLDGGGGGCMDVDEQPDGRRRFYHHLTAYGFGLCFASTSIATLYHFAFGWPAPYGWLSLPVVLGTLGGIGFGVRAGGAVGREMAA